MQFYIREAWLLDERRLKEWLDLFTGDVLYSTPGARSSSTPTSDNNLSVFL